MQNRKLTIADEFYDMKNKKLIVLGVCVVSIAVLTAWFVSYDNKKLLSTLKPAERFAKTAQTQNTNPSADNPLVATDGTGVGTGDLISDTPALPVVSDGGQTAQQQEVVGDYSVSDVAAHSTVSSCWMIMDNLVYDFTDYVPMHPGGTQDILDYCGTDGTAAFNSVGHSSFARGLFDRYYLGTLQVVPGSIPVENTAQTSYSEILERFPGATIVQEERKDDGRIEVEIRYDGDEYEVELDSSGAIISVEEED